MSEQESEVVRNDRIEQASLRDASDGGGTRRVGGTRYYIEDLPSGAEL